MPSPEITLHVLPPSHPCKTAEAALDLKGLEYERVVLVPGEHNAEIERIYRVERGTVPGMVIDGEPVHGSRPILERLEKVAPEPSLYPAANADAVREAERWGDEEFQDLGRRLPWGGMHFRPESMGTFGGAGPLDPAGTDFAIRYVKASWKYHGISAERLADDLAGLPEKLDRIDEFAEQDAIDGDAASAADLQIGATARVLLTLGDLRPLLEGRAAERIALRWFPDYPGDLPAGAFPAGWVPSR